MGAANVLVCSGIVVLSRLYRLAIYPVGYRLHQVGVGSAEVWLLRA